MIVTLQPPALMDLDALTRTMNGTTRETGGGLFGFETAGGLTVAFVSGPGPNAAHESLLYTSDPAYQQGWHDALVRANGREYLGEWHSHPHPTPLTASPATC